MNLARLLFLSFLTFAAVTCNAADGDCALQKPITSADATPTQLQSFFGQIVSLCKNNQEEAYFSLLTSSVRNKMPSEMKKAAFAQYCKFILEAHRSIGDRPENGVHSIQSAEGRRNQCGHPYSYWYIHTKSGGVVFRLKLAMENGQIKINDH